MSEDEDAKRGRPSRKRPADSMIEPMSSQDPRKSSAALDEARPVIVLDCGGGISALRAQIYAATSSPRAALIMRPVGILSATARSESNCK